MDTEKLDLEIRQILSREDGSHTYSEIREELVEKGYSPEELRYILGLVDEKLVAHKDKGDQGKTAKRNMILGAILLIIGLLVIGSSYFGQQAPKEVYYVSLVIFAVGYLVFRNGFRQRGKRNSESD